MDLRRQNSNVYSLTAITGLLILALHTMGMGVSDPTTVFTARAFTLSFPDLWPYLALSVGVFAQRRWARGLAAPTAFLALVAALASFPRYLCLDLGYGRFGSGLLHAPAHGVLYLFRGELLQQAALAAVCAGTFYALTRPELIQRCEADAGQIAWTRGMSFAALLPLGRQFFTLGQALNLALARFSGGADLLTANRPNLEPAVLAVLAVAVLVGLGWRRAWGWWLALAQTLWVGSTQARDALGRALDAFYRIQAKAPAAAPWLAGEAACRFLPELAVLGCVLAALLASRRQFRA